MARPRKRLMLDRLVQTLTLTLISSRSEPPKWRKRPMCNVHNLCTLCKIRIFPGKSGRATVPNLCPSNIIPSFGKILGAVLREKCSRTNGPTITSLTSTDVENCNAASSKLYVRKKETTQATANKSTSTFIQTIAC